MGDTNMRDLLSRQNESDDKKILKFIAGMNIFKKNIGIYPPGHSAISRSAEPISAMLDDLFTRTPTITINAIKHNLLINGKLLDTKNIHAHNFALFISKLGIASLTLIKGLNWEELENFCQKALTIPLHHHIYQYREILDDINTSAHVKVIEIDLTAVRFIDEEVVEHPQGRMPMTVWQKLMLCCLSPELQNVQDTAMLKMIKIYDQGSFNTFVQAFNIPEERLLQSYSLVLQDHFQKSAEAEEALQQKQEFFRSMYRAFNEFSPELKEQILSVTFDSLNESTNEESLEEFLGCIPGDMVVEILTQAVLNKKVISPTLIKLLSVLYRAGKQTTEEPSPERQSVGSKPVWDRIEELFSREGYEKYLSVEYAEQLQNLSLGSDNNRNGSQPRFAGEEHLQTFRDKSVNRHLTSAMLFLMQGDIDEQIYCDFAETIIQTIPEMLQSGDYKQLVNIYKFLDKHRDTDKGPEACKAAERSLNLYAKEEFTAKLASIYSARENGRQSDLEELIMISGTNNLPWMINQYLRQKKAEKAHQTFELLCLFGLQTAEVALKKLEESEGEQAITLLKLIRSCGDSLSGSKIHSMLKSGDMVIRLEVIKTLLQLKDPAAINALREMIRSREDDTWLRALKILHDYKVHDLSFELVSQVKTFYISDRALNRNKAILTLLGRLGNAEILSMLNKKARARLSLSPANLRQTQEYLYKTLAGYPGKSIEGFIRQGLQSKNENICIVCRKLKELNEPGSG